MKGAKQPHRKQGPEWTDERIETLTEMWNADAPATRIAKRLHTTKNSIIGKARRLGLKARTWNPNNITFKDWTPSRLKWLEELFEEGLTHARIVEIIGNTSKSSVAHQLAKMGLKRDRRSLGQTQVSQTVILRNGTVVAGDPNQRPGRPDNAQAWEPLPGVEPVSFIDRKRHQCSWPIGKTTGADMLCCGANRLIEKPYCPSHYDLSCSAEQPKDLGKMERSHRRLIGRYAA